MTDPPWAYDTIAEISGTDPKLKDEVVMIGGHLNSWIAGTGATDNGAGPSLPWKPCASCNRLHVNRAATIRIALWSGEEEGIEAIFLYDTAMRDEMLPQPKLPLNENDKSLEGCIRCCEVIVS